MFEERETLDNTLMTWKKYGENQCKLGKNEIKGVIKGVKCRILSYKKLEIFIYLFIFPLKPW
jgi:hypothetical protein